MMLELAESLVTRRRVRPRGRRRALPRLVCRRAARREPHHADRHARALATGTPWDLASRRAYEVLGFPTAGNGSVMRCAPIALRYAADPEARRRVSLRESTLTHYDHLAGWSCVALNELLVAAMAGRLDG